MVITPLCFSSALRKTLTMKATPLHQIYPYYMHIMDRTELRNGMLFWSADSGNKAAGKPVGTIHRDGYITVCVKPKGYKSKHIKLHRLIWWLHNGPVPDHLEVDHINGIRSDNRIENLQLLTFQENLDKRVFS